MRLRILSVDGRYRTGIVCWKTARRLAGPAMGRLQLASLIVSMALENGTLGARAFTLLSL